MHCTGRQARPGYRSGEDASENIHTTLITPILSELHPFLPNRRALDIPLVPFNPRFLIELRPLIRNLHPHRLQNLLALLDLLPTHSHLISSKPQLRRLDGDGRMMICVLDGLFCQLWRRLAGERVPELPPYTGIVRPGSVEEERSKKTTALPVVDDFVRGRVFVASVGCSGLDVVGAAVDWGCA